MPKYLVESPSGQTLEIEGDAPPTEKELDDIFASVAPKDTGSDLPRIKPSVAAAVDPAQIQDKRVDTEALADAGVRGAPPAIGQSIGAATGFAAPVAVPVLGFIGGLVGEYLGNLREKRAGTLGSYTRAGLTSAVPGGPLAKAGTREVLREGTKYAAGELAGYASEALIDEDKELSATGALTSIASGYAGAGAGKAFASAAPVSDMEELFLKRNENFRALRNAGAKVGVNPAEMGRAETAVAFAGPATLEKKIATKNAVEFQKLIRSDAGLPESGKYRKAIDFDGELMPLRKSAYEPYETIQKLHEEAVDELSAIKSKYSSPQELAAALDTPEAKKLIVNAAADVDLLKETREKAKDAYDLLKSGGNPDAYKNWKSLTEQADVIEDAIEEAGKLSGDANLLPRLKSARRLIAKTYSIENALNKDTGIVDAIELAAMKEDGVPLDGGLEKIAAFANSFDKESVDAAKLRNRGSGKMTATQSTQQAAQGNIPGAIGGVVSMVSGPALRPMLASDWFQKYMLKTPKERQNFMSSLARFYAENAINGVMEEQVPSDGVRR